MNMLRTDEERRCADEVFCNCADQPDLLSVRSLTLSPQTHRNRNQGATSKKGKDGDQNCRFSNAPHGGCIRSQNAQVRFRLHFVEQRCFALGIVFSHVGTTQLRAKAVALRQNNAVESINRCIVSVGRVLNQGVLACVIKRQECVALDGSSQRQQP